MPEIGKLRDLADIATLVAYCAVHVRAPWMGRLSLVIGHWSLSVFGMNRAFAFC
jgi:hypothetical protein